MHSLLNSTENVTAGMTWRDSNRSESNNMALHSCQSEEAVLANREHLARELGVPLHRFVLANQTHSDHFYEVTNKDLGKGTLSAETAIRDTDALFTYEQSIVLGAFTADCVPLLLWSSKSTLVAAVHSGWQGTVKEIVPKLLHFLQNEKNEDPLSLHVYIGPALSEQRFEVDADVADRYKQLGYADPFIRYEDKTGKFHIDNILTVKEQCLRAGIPGDNITYSSTCTFTSEHGFSYRQDRQSGRHLGFIYRH